MGQATLSKNTWDLFLFKLSPLLCLLTSSSARNPFLNFWRVWGCCERVLLVVFQPWRISDHSRTTFHGLGPYFYLLSYKISKKERKRSHSGDSLMSKSAQFDYFPWMFVKGIYIHVFSLDMFWVKKNTITTQPFTWFLHFPQSHSSVA